MIELLSLATLLGLIGGGVSLAIGPSLLLTVLLSAVALAGFVLRWSLCSSHPGQLGYFLLTLSGVGGWMVGLWLGYIWQ